MSLLNPNRVLAHAAQVQAVIDSGHKPDGTPIGDTRALNDSLALSITEYIAFQDIKSRAQAMGRITLDEAMTIYAALGHEMSDPANGGWGHDTTLAMKVTVTMLIGQIA